MDSSELLITAQTPEEEKVIAQFFEALPELDTPHSYEKDRKPYPIKHHHGSDMMGRGIWSNGKSYIHVLYGR